MARGRFAPAGASGSRPIRGASANTEDRRRQILEAAAEVICAEGFGETRIAHIAQRAGVSGGTIIYHFGTLDRLLVDALLHAEQAFYDEAERIVGQSATPRQRLERLIGWVFAPSENNARLWALWLETWSHAARHPELGAARAQQHRRWRSMITGIASELPLGRHELERFAVSFGALLDGLIVQVALHDPEVGADRAREIAISFAAVSLGT